MIAKFIFMYFWLFSVIAGVINYFITKQRIPRELEPAKEMEVNTFLRKVLAFLTIPYFLLFLLQFAGGFVSPFYIFSKDVNNIYVLLSWAVIIVTWGLTLYGVLFRNGAWMIVEYDAIFRFKMPSNETAVKIIFVIMVLGGILGSVFGISADLASTQIPGL